MCECKQIEFEFKVVHAANKYSFIWMDFYRSQSIFKRVFYCSMRSASESYETDDHVQFLS